MADKAIAYQCIAQHNRRIDNNCYTDTGVRIFVRPLTLMPCAFCGQNNPTVRAHALPEAFFRELRADQSTLLMITNIEGAYTKRAPIGVYDQDVICERCEILFGPYDTYGAEVLINRRDELFKPIQRGMEVLAFEGDGIDQHRLKMFVLSVLWRSSVSKQPFYNRVRLGPFQELLRQKVVEFSCTDPDDFSVLLSRWVASKHREQLANGLMCPFLERWEGINAIRIYFGRTVAYIKLDKRPFPESLRTMVLGRFSKAFMVAREFDTSKDFAAMINVARASE